jgi:hypothetical protein
MRKQNTHKTTKPMSMMSLISISISASPWNWNCQQLLSFFLTSIIFPNNDHPVTHIGTHSHSRHSFFHQDSHSHREKKLSKQQTSASFHHFQYMRNMKLHCAHNILFITCKVRYISIYFEDAISHGIKIATQTIPTAMARATKLLGEAFVFCMPVCRVG